MEERVVNSKKNFIIKCLIDLLPLFRSFNEGDSYSLFLKMYSRTFYQSFSYAFKGLIYALKTERNMRIHLVFGIVAFLMGKYFALSSIELIILLFTILFVLIAEMSNTAVEVMLDFINGKKHHPKIKIVKDITAGAVLLSSINALIVGWLLFYPHLAKI